jgi:hypothetical protein
MLEMLLKLKLRIIAFKCHKKSKSGNNRLNRKLRRLKKLNTHLLKVLSMSILKTLINKFMERGLILK